jgi:hypothetical protein
MQSDWCAQFDPVSQSLRTRQASLFSKADEPGTELCLDWPRSGMICGGMYFPLPRLVQDICESASSSLLPTPTGRDWKDTPGMNLEPGGGGNGTTSYRAGFSGKFLPTPIASDGKARGTMNNKCIQRRKEIGKSLSLSMVIPSQICAGECSQPRQASRNGGLRLTPEFLCWLMGFPPGWLKPLRDALGMPLSRKSSGQSPEQSDKC